MIPPPPDPSLLTPSVEVDRQHLGDTSVDGREEDTPKPPSGIPPDYDPTASLPPSPTRGRSSLSYIRPANAEALRRSLYRSPHAVATFRREAAELFISSSALDAASVPTVTAVPSDNLYATEKDGNNEAKSSLPEKRTRRLIDRARWESDLSASELEPDLNRPLDATLRARDSPLAARKVERGGAVGKAVARGSGRGIMRGRTRGMERRKTITAATQARPSFVALPDVPTLPPTSGSPSPSGTAASSTVLSPGQTRRRQSSSGSVPTAGYARPTGFSTFDPLHIPSLLRLALEGLLLGPLRVRITRLFSARTSTGKEDELTSPVSQKAEVEAALKEGQRDGERQASLMPVALLAGAFCAGVGVGVILARSRA